MSGQENTFDSPSFRQWLTDRYGMTMEDAAYAKPIFLRGDGWFDVVAYEAWIQDRYREYQEYEIETRPGEAKQSGAKLSKA